VREKLRSVTLTMMTVMKMILPKKKCKRAILKNRAQLLKKQRRLREEWTMIS